MQHYISTWFRASDQRAQPCVQREQSKQSQRRARFADQHREGGDGRHGARTVDEGVRGDFRIVACGADEVEELCRERGERGGFGLQVCEDVERVVECG
jgi:hypothetical protein